MLKLVRTLAGRVSCPISDDLYKVYCEYLSAQLDVARINTGCPRVYARQIQTLCHDVDVVDHVVTSYGPSLYNSVAVVPSVDLNSAQFNIRLGIPKCRGRMGVPTYDGMG